MYQGPVLSGTDSCQLCRAGVERGLDVGLAQKTESQAGLVKFLEP